MFEIRYLRKKLNLTQQQFAVKLGVSLSTIRYWESGKHFPSNLAMQKIKEIQEEKHEDKM